MEVNAQLTRATNVHRNLVDEVGAMDQTTHTYCVIGTLNIDLNRSHLFDSVIHRTIRSVQKSSYPYAST